MSRTLSTSARNRTLAALAAAALAITGCSQAETTKPSPDVSATTSQEATTATPAPTESATTSAAPTQGSPDAAKALADLTYRGEPLTALPPVQVDAYVESIRSALRTEGATFEPEVCGKLNTELNEKLIAHTSDLSLAAGEVDGAQVVAQVSPGGADGIDFGNVTDVITKCPQFTVSAHGQSITSAVSLIPTSIAADSSLGQHVTQELPNGTVHVYTMLAKVGSTLVTTVLTTTEDTDIADLEELTSTIATRL